MEEEINESSDGERDGNSAEENASSDDLFFRRNKSHTSSSDQADREDDDPYNNCDSDEPPPEKRRKKPPPEKQRKKPPPPPPEEDRISNMPDSILLHILSFLPTASVVRTGALSRRWQYLWTSVPTLDFTYTGDHSRFNPDKFSTFIDRTLILHKCCKVNRFVLDFKYNESLASLVDVWVRFATRANVEELNLFYFFGCSNTDIADITKSHLYVLPQHIYTNSSITKLLFYSCIVEPIGSIDWRHLKSLSMGHIYLSEDVLQKIFLGSPVLEFLELISFVSTHRLHVSSASLRKLVIGEYGYPRDVSELLEITAPNIQSLEVSGCMFMKRFRLKNVESLVECSLTFELSFDTEEDEDDDNAYREQHKVIMKLLYDLRHVEKLTIGGYCLKTLSAMEAKGIPSPRSSRKYLILESLHQKYDFPGIASLLESSPNLEKLVIDMSASPYNYESPEYFSVCHKFVGRNYWTSQERSYTCLLLHLKTVKIVGFKTLGDRSKLVFPLAEFLLKSARKLEKMVINARKVSPGESQKAPPDPSYLYQVTQKLLSFPRYSREAVVLFSE